MDLNYYPLKLSKLSLDQKKLVTSYLKKYPSAISEQTFSNLYMWRGFRKTYLLELKDTLLFFVERPDFSLSLFTDPIGRLTIEELFENSFLKYKSAIRLSSSNAYPLLKRGWQAIASRDQSDYVYRVEDLKLLEGKKYENKRHLIRNALRDHQCQIQILHHDRLEECKALLRENYELNLLEKKNYSWEAYQAELELITHYLEFSLVGALLEVDGELSSLMIGEELNPTTFVVHIWKTKQKTLFASSLMIHQFVKEIIPNYQWINLEQDLGIPGIRTFKERYYPSMHMIKWDCISPE